MTTSSIKQELRKVSCPQHAKVLQRFFKTGPGEYGEGDIFIGVKVPAIRKLAKAHKDFSLKDISQLIQSTIHEERLLALLILVQQMEKGDEQTQKRICKLYLGNTKYINNWDLVDLSAYKLLGLFLFPRSRKPLYRLARSSSLWERRIAIIATFHFIKRGEHGDTLKIAKILLKDKEDLIHKAVGWMLREIGKRDQPLEEIFLQEHRSSMPRTMLRYAIERFPEPLRQHYLEKSQ